MKRTNTADEMMIAEIRALRNMGVTGFICTAMKKDDSRKVYKPVMKHTAQGISAYANKMYNRHGDCISVEVGYFDDNCVYHIYTIYSA